MRKTRSGGVTEFGTCSSRSFSFQLVLSTLTASESVLDTTRQELEKKTEAEKNLTQELKIVSGQLNSTLLQLNNTILQLNSTLLELTNVSTELNRTSAEVQEISTRLNQTELDLRRATQELEMYNNSRNKWDWEIFKSEQYINTTITAEQAEQLQTSWDSVARKDKIDSLLHYNRLTFCLI